MTDSPRRPPGAAAPFAAPAAPRSAERERPLEHGPVGEQLAEQPDRPEHLELYYRDDDRDAAIAEILENINRHADAAAETAEAERLALAIYEAGHP